MKQNHSGVTASQDEAGVKSPPPPMARYKPYDYCQTRLIPVSLAHQLLRGTLEHTIHVLVENMLDMSLFDCRYKNDETGCPAYDPKILLKVILFAYSRGIIGSRRIERLCRNHVICMALACMQCPDHSTIAAFVSSMSAEILALFCDVLLVCEEQQLLGGTVFALDGLKLPSNASKAWSGTLEELQHKQEKLEAKIAQLLAEHQQADAEEQETPSLSVTPQPTSGEDVPSPLRRRLLPRFSPKTSRRPPLTRQMSLVMTIGVPPTRARSSRLALRKPSHRNGARQTGTRPDAGRPGSGNRRGGSGIIRGSLGRARSRNGLSG